MAGGGGRASRSRHRDQRHLASRSHTSIREMAWLREAKSTLDIASFPGHGNEATLDTRKRRCVRSRAALPRPTHNYHADGVGQSCFSPRVMAARKRTNGGVVSQPCFLRSPNPLRLNGEKMTPLHCFGLSES